MKKTIGLHFFISIFMLCPGLVFCQSILPDNVRSTASKWARAKAICDNYGGDTQRKACDQKEKFKSEIERRGLKIDTVAKILDDECRQMTSVYSIAAIARDMRMPPEMAYKKIKNDNSIKISDQKIKDSINKVFFAPHLSIASERQITVAVHNDCLYGQDEEMKPLK